MAITPLPTPVPSSEDPANFDARADAFLEALPGFVTEANALAADLNDLAEAVDAAADAVAEDAATVEAAAMAAAEAAGLVATSTSTLSVGAGTKTIHFAAAKPLLAVVNKQIVIVQTSDASIKMFATVATAPDSDDITATVVSGGVFGSGSYSSWQIIDAAFFGSAATAAELWAQVTDAAAISPKTVKDAKVWVPLTDGATVTPNGLNGRNFTWTVGGDRTLGAITNCAPGDIFHIWGTQGGGWDLAWASGVYKRQGGLPTLPQTASQKFHLEIRILSVDGSGTATSALVTFASNPTN